LASEPHRKLIAFLTAQQAEYQLVAHQAAGLSVEVSQARGTDLHQDAKALLLETSGAASPYVIAVTPADLQVHTKRLRKNQGWRDAKLADRETVRRITGCEIGEVPPFGELFGLPTYVDERLYDNLVIAFNAADLHCSILISASEFRRISGATVDRFARSRDGAGGEG